MENTYKLRFIPLGGVVGVTKNMYVYENYVNDVLKDILIVDCGIGFPMEKELGVDFVIPDITYLKDKTDKIRALLVTHGHEDHTSAIPYHYKDLGSPPIYTSNLTASFIENKFKEFGITEKVNRVEYRKDYEFGDFKARFINITHSIPDATHIQIKTPVGNLYHGPDFKLDLTPPYGAPPDFYEITKAGHDGLLCLLSDALGSERDGLTLSEAIVGSTFEDTMRKTKGKFIMTTFSSNISRIRQCVEAAIKFNRKIVFLGRSMRQNTEIAKAINYLPIPFNLVGKEDEVMKLPANKVCLIVAGSQGQYGSALSKLANKMNKFVKITPGDRVIISSDPIPGNETEVYSLIEELTMQGADVIYSDIQDQLHASGHGSREDLKFLIRFTNPAYFIPIGGTIRHQQEYRKLAESLGHKPDSVFLLREGDSVWFTKNKATRGEVIETKSIYVDAYGIGDIGSAVLRDRKTLSSEGIVVAVLPLGANGRLVARPKIMSKGFVFEKVGQELFEEATRIIEKKLKPQGTELSDMNKARGDTVRELETYFFKETGRKPLILVETIQI
ncbi:ribonuclease J [Candidatus Roizmanbacteria bacterium]|nr:ribonuclease J [Candidatus Roizmanbacteria bacterium]